MHAYEHFPHETHLVFVPLIALETLTFKAYLGPLLDIVPNSVT